MFLGAPVWLGSTSGLVIGIGLVVLFALRIVAEEKLLARELEGYADYLRKVRFRLIPFIW